MGNPPRIWLDYRPVRIGWVVADRDIAQLTTAASWNSCLWGGRFNPIIPIAVRERAAKLISVFGVDVLLPVQATDETAAFIGSYPHLHYVFWTTRIFSDRRSEFVDIRHAVKRFARHMTVGGRVGPLVRPVWAATDPLAPLFDVLLGRHPDPATITIDYVRGIRSVLDMPDKVIAEGQPLSPEFLQSIAPLTFTGFDLSHKRERSGWSNPGILLGTATDFDDLLLFWNLRAAGASICFHDLTRADRTKGFAEAFLAALRERPAEAGNRVNFWSRATDWPPQQWSSDLDVSDLTPSLCRSAGDGLWNGLNVRPVRPQFSTWHRDVVPSYIENEDGAAASFALPDRPCDDEDPQTLSQHYVVTVDADQYGFALDDDLIFATPFVPRMNEFYGRNFHREYDKARSEPGRLGHGAVGIISSIGDQRLQVRALHVHQWMQQFFELFGVTVERSEPGLRCSRLIRQVGGLLGCRVFKVRGARALIRKYGPDQSFTRSAAERCIGNFDETTRQMRFSEFEHLYIQPREGGKLTPGEVLQYMTARGVFRIGLDFKCPNCELANWLHLDEIKTISTCTYCGHHFDVTPQLKDRDWRYRRSGLFGRNDNQLGGIPVTLAIQQLATSLHDSLLMYSTALEFKSASAVIDPCEADLVAVVAGAAGIRETPVQILFGEGKTASEFDADDVRKLGRLADAVPADLADAFILFAKTEAFTGDEIRLAQTLNTQHRRRVILWSREELEPFDLYERSEAKLGQQQYATTLSDMANVTEQLWFSPPATSA